MPPAEWPTTRIPSPVSADRPSIDRATTEVAGPTPTIIAASQSLIPSGAIFTRVAPRATSRSDIARYSLGHVR
jgi:hypothetical protein